jgi:hypothetical protein
LKEEKDDIHVDIGGKVKDDISMLKTGLVNDGKAEIKSSLQNNIRTELKEIEDQKQCLCILNKTSVHIYSMINVQHLRK